MEYQSIYLTSAGFLYGIYESSNVIQLPLPGSRLVQDAAGCFNFLRACGTDGSLWQGPFYNSGIPFSTTPGAWWTQILTDSTNASITNAIGLVGSADDCVMLRADSSLWFMGADDIGIFHSSGTIEMRPYKMTTGSQKFKKVIISGFAIWAISSDGMTVYTWTNGSGQTPSTVSFSGKGTGKVLDIGSANGNAFSNATVALVQQTTGSSYGKVYIQGSGYGLWGAPSAQSFSSFTDMTSQWGLTSLVSEVCVNSNTIGFIDSLQNMYCTGFQVQGEVGNGIEFVNRYTYSSWPNYGWDFTQENAMTTGVVQIAPGHKFSQVYSNNFFTFYHNALDVNDSLYVWGRNKTVVLPVGPNGTRTGLLDLADNPNNPNAQDVLVPTLAHPFTQNNLTLNWTGPTISTPTQNITVSSTTLTLGGHPALLVNAANSTDTVNYLPSTYAWSQLTGPNTASLSSTTARTPTVSGLITGTYTFQVLTTDNNTGLNRSVETVNVAIPASNPTIKIVIGSQIKFTNISP